MTDARWDFARATFATHFAPLIEAGYQLERVADTATYWRIFAETLEADFPREVFFDLVRLRDDAARAGMAQLDAARDDHPLVDLHLVRKDGALVAMFSGEQRARGLYRMWNTVVGASHRRHGLYRRILDATIAYTRALGFDGITSEHAPSNNPVIIAKLQAGFHIYGLDIDPMAGPSLILRYFHHPSHLAAYEVRCGLAAMTPELRAAGIGAFAELAAQLTPR